MPDFNTNKCVRFVGIDFFIFIVFRVINKRVNPRTFVGRVRDEGCFPFSLIIRVRDNGGFPITIELSVPIFRNRGRGISNVFGDIIPTSGFNGRGVSNFSFIDPIGGFRKVEIFNGLGG